MARIELRTRDEELGKSNMADARLIAAAPDLLEIAQAICALLDTFRVGGDEMPAFDDPCGLVGDLETDGLHEKLTAAIARTTGAMS